MLPQFLALSLVGKSPFGVGDGAASRTSDGTIGEGSHQATSSLMRHQPLTGWGGGGMLRAFLPHPETWSKDVKQFGRRFLPMTEVRGFRARPW